jgi:hypothetical protein
MKFVAFALFFALSTAAFANPAIQANLRAGFPLGGAYELNERFLEAGGYRQVAPTQFKSGPVEGKPDVVEFMSVSRYEKRAPGFATQPARMVLVAKGRMKIPADSPAGGTRIVGRVLVDSVQLVVVPNGPAPQ